MRSISSLQDEIKTLKGSAALMKWLGIFNAIASLAAGIQMFSLAIFSTGMLGAMFFFGSYFCDLSRVQRMEEEIEERLDD